MRLIFNFMETVYHRKELLLTAVGRESIIPVMHPRRYEVEVKALLSSDAQAGELVAKMRQVDSRLKEGETSIQLTHYFTGGDLGLLPDTLRGYLSPDDVAELARVTTGIKDFSLRTQETNGQLRLIFKTSTDAESSAHGTVRLEWEVAISGLTQEQLDQLVLSCGFQYQSKWSRERREYVFEDVEVTVDKTPGYGYLAEFEVGVDLPEEFGSAKEKIHQVMAKLELEELKQDRLDRMFTFYNAHWSEYYGTDKVFVIE